MEWRGGWVIFSQLRHENRSRTVWITFHWRGITSSVSVMSSPSFDSFAEPQHGTNRCCDHHPLARQMRGERLAGWSLPLEGPDGLGYATGLLGRQLIVSGVSCPPSDRFWNRRLC